MEKLIQNAINDRIIEEAGSYYGISFKQIKYIGGFENFVYEYEKADKLFILRLVHSSHRSFELVSAEIEFIDYLSKGGANVSNVVPTLSGEVLVKVPCENEEYFTVSTFTRAPGTYVKREQVTPEFNIEFGKAVGKLHALTKNYNPVHKREQWFEEDFLDIGKRNLPEEYRYMIGVAEELIAKLKKLPTDIDSYGLIHTDLHFGNLYYDGDVITFFDWDDSSYKHFISDIAIIIFYMFAFSDLTEEKTEDLTYDFLTNFCKGYLQENDLSLKWFDHLNDFLKLREIILFFVIFGAGEEMIEGKWGKGYIDKYADRIKNKTPFFNQERATKR